jgi:hypothetical protein
MGRDFKNANARRPKGGASGFFRITLPLSYHVLLSFVNTSICDHKHVNM